MSKLRVWWIPQVGIEETFYVPVSTVEEGKKTLDLLAAYDAFQLQNNVKPDYTNVGGLQMWDEEEQEWNDWYLETDEDYFDDVDEYISSTDKADEIDTFTHELFKQIDWEKIERMTR